MFHVPRPGDLLRKAAFVSSFLLLSVSAQAIDPSSARVVSLSPSLTELVFALGFGDRLIGRSSACDYPPEAARAPVVGDFGRANLEVLESLKPDLVVATDLEKPGIAKRLDDMGIAAKVLPCEGWDQLMQAAREISASLGDPGAGDRWVQSMQERRSALEKRVGEHFATTPRPRVYIEVWGDPPTTAGGVSFLHDVVTLAGGVNVAASLAQKYPHVGSEWVVRANPDVILLAYMMGTASPGDVGKRPGWGQIRAVQTGSICSSIPPDLLLRPGPRIIDGAEALAGWLTAEDGRQKTDGGRETGAAGNQQPTTNNR